MKKTIITALALLVSLSSCTSGEEIKSMSTEARSQVLHEKGIIITITGEVQSICIL